MAIVYVTLNTGGTVNSNLIEMGFGEFAEENYISRVRVQHLLHKCDGRYNSVISYFRRIMSVESIVKIRTKVFHPL